MVWVMILGGGNVRIVVRRTAGEARGPGKGPFLMVLGVVGSFL